MRDFTKGHPDIEANNHPIRHGSVVGVHNGVLANDDELLARYGIERHEPGMTVDSEAIFALMELRRNDSRALSELRGTMAAAWLDERDPETLFLARGVARPLWIGRTRTDLFFASTRRALTIVEALLRFGSTPASREGRLLASSAGGVVGERRFRADRRYREAEPVSPVHSPHEAVSCLGRSPCSRRSSASRARERAPTGRGTPLPLLPAGCRPAPVAAVVAQPLADEVLERRPRASRHVEQSVHLPL